MNSTTLQFPDGESRTFWFRPDTSDGAMVRQTFEDRAFDLGTLKRWPEIVRWLRDHPEPLIVDAGANIGTSAVWFAKMVPGSHVVALEPERSNWEMLKRNVDGLAVGWFRVALGARSGWGNLYHPDGAPTVGRGHAAFRVAKDQPGDTQIDPMDVVLGWAPTAAVNVMGGGKSNRAPFLAKIDIEGAEADVFSGDVSWIDRFPVLIVELHDWLYPGERTSAPFIRAMADSNRDFIVRGEHVISIRNPI